MSDTYPILIERGATFGPLIFTFLVGETEETAVPRDLTGLDIVFRLFRPARAGGVVDYTVASGNLVITPAAGQVALSFTDEQTDMTFSHAPYKIVATDASDVTSGVTDFLIEGPFRVK